LSSDEKYFDELRDKLVGKPPLGLPLFDRVHEEKAQLSPHFLLDFGHRRIRGNVLVDSAVGRVLVSRQGHRLDLCQ